MKVYNPILVCLVLFAACGGTLPKQARVIDTSSSTSLTPVGSGPADVAVLPFENRTGDQELNWLRATISATMSVRFRERKGWTVADGSFVREMMAGEQLPLRGTLDPETAIGLSGVLFAETLIAGSFEGIEHELTITATHYSGETGEALKTATRTVDHNNRSALINQLIEDLTREKTPAPVVTENGNAGDVDFLGPIGRSRTRTRVDRLAIRLPALFQMDTPEQTDRAVRLYRRALELNPNYADAHFALGYAFDKKGDREKALASYRQAATLEPLNADYLFLLGYTYERNENIIDAIDAYEKALTTKPDDADIAFSLGYAYEQTGQYSDAIGAYSRAIELKPEDYDSYYGLASVYESSGRLREAMESFQRVVTLKPEEDAPLRTLGAVAVKLDRWDEVARTYEILLERNPDDVDAYRMLAIAYKRLGHAQKAIDAYKQVIRIEPSSSEVYARIGNLYVGLKKYENAIEQYQAGLVVDPESELLYYNLGNVLAAQQDYRAAIDAYAGYLRMAPDGRLEQKVREKVEDLRFRIMSSEQ